MKSYCGYCIRRSHICIRWKDWRDSRASCCACTQYIATPCMYTDRYTLYLLEKTAYSFSPFWQQHTHQAPWLSQQGTALEYTVPPARLSGAQRNPPPGYPVRLKPWPVVCAAPQSIALRREGGGEINITNLGSLAGCCRRTESLSGAKTLLRWRKCSIRGISHTLWHTLQTVFWVTQLAAEKSSQREYATIHSEAKI